MTLLFGASLIALEKKDGGVRAIAVGCTLRHLVAKCAGNSVMQALGELLDPSNGVLASRREQKLQSMPPEIIFTTYSLRTSYRS